MQPFTFAIPLIARSVAADWGLVEALLGLTLSSLAAQTDKRFEILVAGHDRPDLDLDGLAVEFVRVDWPVEPVHPANLDSGRKKGLLNTLSRARGGGLVMFLDADDWVDTRLVATARASIACTQIGGLIESGYAVDVRNRRILPIPHPAAFAGGFDRLCGSSTILRIDLAAADPIRSNPYDLLHEHYRWDEMCRSHGLSAARLDLSGAYVVNTSANHSAAQGPYAQWRRTFDGCVAREGAPIDPAFLARFGLDPEHLASIARWLPDTRAPESQIPA